jgi:hypothetical protein
MKIKFEVQLNRTSGEPKPPFDLHALLIQAKIRCVEIASTAVFLLWMLRILRHEFGL